MSKTSPFKTKLELIKGWTDEELARHLTSETRSQGNEDPYILLIAEALARLLRRPQPYFRCRLDGKV